MGAHTTDLFTGYPGVDEEIRRLAYRVACSRPKKMQWEELFERLREAGSHGVCPMCGERRWGAFSDQPESHEVQTHLISGVKPTGQVFPGHGIVVYALACKGCGFVALHSAHALFPEGASDEEVSES